MSERYDRIVRAGELILRNTIAQKMVAGRNVVDSFRLPASVTIADRVGKGPFTGNSSSAEIDQSQSESEVLLIALDLLAPVKDQLDEEYCQSHVYSAVVRSTQGVPSAGESESCEREGQTP